VRRAGEGPRAAPDPVDGRSPGGKARNLARLRDAGLPVPRFGVVDGEVCRRFAQRSGVAGEIELALRGLESEGVPAAARRIAAAFAAAGLDAASANAIEQAYREAGGGRVAVRSSSRDEDSELSFAGQHDSFLNVDGGAAVAQRVKDCWASAFSERTLGYRLAHGLPWDLIDMAVIVQAMARSEKSGVLFTVNPMSGRTDELVISALYGLGEGLVSGAVDADTVIVDRASGAIKSTTIGEKRERFDGASRGSGVVAQPVPAPQRRSSALEAEEIGALNAAAARIEALFGSPQDIEWAIAEQSLVILQSRPVTSGLPAPAAAAGEPDIRIWDNSNILESYGDVTSPLTFSFASHLYRTVYRSYCELLGVPRGQMGRIEDWLGCMLGYFHGRVYYNLLNWYKLIRLVPFYRLNRAVLETAMGLQEPLDDELAERQQPFRFRGRGHELRVRSRIALRFAWHYLTVERSVRRFIDEFYETYRYFDAIDYAELPAQETYRRFQELEARLLTRWAPLIMLENVNALAFGVLHVLTRRWLPNAPPWLLWEMTRVRSDVESAEPARRMQALAELVGSDRRLRELICSTAPDRALDAIRGTAEAAPLALEVDRYLDDFGYRNLNELKLEEPDLRDDPSVLFSMLRSTLEHLETEGHAVDHGDDVERHLDPLRPWQRWIYGRARAKVQRCLTARERGRFCRTRAFGMVRRMIKAIGADLARDGTIDAPDDVFYLRLEELRGCLQGTFPARELRGLAALRRTEQEADRKLTAPGRFTTTSSSDVRDPAALWSAAAATEAAAPGSALHGTPCGPGVAIARASVVDRPCDVGGDVLVAYRTDPGWIAALRSASGLAIERGSPLTHVAVVARELRIPTVVQVPGLTKRLRSGMRIRLDGGAGTIQILDRDGERPEPPAG